MQGTAADLIKLSMIKVQEVLDAERRATKMIMQVHDELVFEVPEDELEWLEPRCRASWRAWRIDGAAAGRDRGGRELGRGALKNWMRTSRAEVARRCGTRATPKEESRPHAAGADSESTHVAIARIAHRSGVPLLTSGPLSSALGLHRCAPQLAHAGGAAVLFSPAILFVPSIVWCRRDTASSPWPFVSVALCSATSASRLQDIVHVAILRPSDLLEMLELR